MAKLTLNDINNTYNTTLINDNFSKIEDEFQDKVLYRDNPTGEPNQMLVNLDMNGKRILNLPQPMSPNEPARLQDVQGLDVITDLVQQAEDAADAAALSETNAAASASAAAASASLSNTYAISSATNAGIANTAATSAASSATAAQNYAAALIGTSTSSNTIGTGPKTFTTQAGKQFNSGQWVVISDSGNSANYMSGPVTSYSSTTLVINAVAASGSGTISSWNISVAGVQGVVGPQGPTGPAGSLTTKDEGTTLTSATNSLNFVGAGVTASTVGNDVTVTIPNTGTVTSASVVNANGFNGSVATATTTPAITLQTTVTGMVKGSSNALVAATAGTDYTAGTSGLATGILKNTTGTGAHTIATAGTDYSAGTSALGTGIVKTTTGTGALTVAVAGDFPTLNQNTTGTAANVTGTVAVANGGTGLTTTPTNGQLDIGNGSGFTRATLTAGSGITITNGAGSISIAASGGGSGALAFLGEVIPSGSSSVVDFLSSFSSTYDEYELHFYRIRTATTNTSINCRLAVSNAADASNNYYMSGNASAGSSASSSWQVVLSTISTANGASWGASGILKISGINSGNSADITALTNAETSSLTNLPRYQGGRWGVTSTATGIQLSNGAAENFSSGGWVRLYGVKKA